MLLYSPHFSHWWLKVGNAENVILWPSLKDSFFYIVEDECQWFSKRFLIIYNLIFSVFIFGSSFFNLALPTFQQKKLRFLEIKFSCLNISWNDQEFDNYVSNNTCMKFEHKMKAAVVIW